MDNNEANSELGLASRRLAMELCKAFNISWADYATKLQTALYHYGHEIAKEAAQVNDA